MKNSNKINNLETDNMNFPRTNLQLYINGKKVNLGNKDKIKARKTRKPKRISKKTKTKKIKEVKLPKKQLKNFSKFSKETPETDIRRLSDRIIYEIKLPGVDSKKQISISRLENSIEIKAVAKSSKKSYYKVLKVSLPIIKYSLEKKEQKLILELAAK